MTTEPKTTENTAPAAENVAAAPAPAAVKKKAGKRRVSEGLVSIQASFNNTLVSISTASGDLLCQGSAGRSGFKGSRKGTPFAAQLAAEMAAKKSIEEFGLRRVEVHVSGPGAGRDSAVRALRNAGLEVIRLVDTTSLPHNGCRPRKKRRV